MYDFAKQTKPNDFAKQTKLNPDHTDISPPPHLQYVMYMKTSVIKNSNFRVLE